MAVFTPTIFYGKKTRKKLDFPMYRSFRVIWPLNCWRWKQWPVHMNNSLEAMHRSQAHHLENSRWTSENKGFEWINGTLAKRKIWFVLAEVIFSQVSAKECETSANIMLKSWCVCPCWPLLLTFGQATAMQFHLALKVAVSTRTFNKVLQGGVGSKPPKDLVVSCWWLYLPSRGRYQNPVR